MVALGVDLGGTKCLGVAIDERGEIVDETRKPTPLRGDGGAVIAVLTEVAQDLLGRHAGVDRVGVGVPGLVDSRGRLRFAPNLPGVVELEVRTGVAAGLGIPPEHVIVENDASCAGWAECTRGAAAGASHALLITLGTGIGAGIVMDGALYRGANGFAGEVGHMVVDVGDAAIECPCGQRGCWERYASGSALSRAAGKPGEQVTASAAAGEAWAVEAMATFGWWVALGLANLANAFDPEVFVLGGGLVEAGDVLLEPVRAAFASLVEGVEHRPLVRVVPATLGEHAGAIGAALLSG